MMALVVLGLFLISALTLAAALIYLYRWLVRKKLFPQLPRLWTGDKKRFIFSFLGFIISLTAFVGTSLFTTAPQPQLGTEALRKQAIRPSFDGQPPPDMASVQAEKIRRAAEKRGLLTTTTTTAPAPPAAPAKTPGMAPKTQAAAPAVAAAPAAAASAPATTTSAPATTTTTTTAPTTTTTAPPATTTTTQAPAPKKPASAAWDKVYTICAASLRDKKAAQRLAGQIKAKGVKAQVVEVNLKKKGRWFRVCLGQFPTPEAARAKSKGYKAQGLAPSPFVTRLR